MMQLYTTNRLLVYEKEKICLKTTTFVVFCFTSKAIVVNASWYGRCDFDVLNFFSETSLLRHSTLSD